MQLLRVRLRDYRGVHERTIDLPPRGVTVIEGPNEAGKSSLAEAIGIVFDLPDSTQRQVVRELQPVDRDAGTEVEVEVETGPYRFVLTKRFNKDRETRLTVTAPRVEHHTGREAHDRALQILSETIDVALWRALCVQQGAGSIQAPLGSCPSLAAALDAAAGGDQHAGQAELGLLDRVQTEYLAFFTERGAPARPVRDAAIATSAAAGAVRDLEARLAAVDRDVERAAELDRDLVGARADLAGSEIATEEAITRERVAREVAADFERLAAQASACSLAAANAGRDLDDRHLRIAQLEQLACEGAEHRAAAALAHERLADAETEQRVWATERERRGATAVAARTLLEVRRRDLDHRREQATLTDLTRRRHRISSALEQAATGREMLTRNSVDDDALATIRALDLRTREARAALEAGSPAVTISAAQSVTVVVDGSPVSASHEPFTQRALEAIRVEVPGVVQVEIGPGTSAEDLVTAHTTAVLALENACRAVAVSDLADAERAARESAAARRALGDAEAVLDEHLGGRRLDDLDEEVAWLAARADDYTASRGDLPPVPATEDDAQALVTAAEVAAAEATDRLAEAEAALERVKVARTVARTDQQREQALADRTAVREAEAHAALEADRSAVPDDNLPNLVASAQAASAAATDARDAAQRALADADPATTAALVANRVEVRDAARRRVRRLEDERRDVSTRLLVRGEEGLYEALEDARAHHDAVNRHEGVLTRRAHAARLLHDTMVACRDAARRSYQEPLRVTIEDLGRVLYGPTFAVEFDDELQISRRILDGVALPFHQLSGGAQEQLALLGRLACAMLVSGDGGVPLVLDDTLGASDPERLERMGAVLRMAGERCQVIVLTCSPQRYRHVGGAHVIRLVA